MPRLRRVGPQPPPGPAVVLIDEGWPQTPYVATKLRNAGCSVHVATATGCPGDIPRPGELGPGITFELLPRLAASDFIEALRAVVTQRPLAVLFPQTERILYRLWSETPEWEERIHPRLEEWQRALLRDKAALSRFVGEHGVRVPAEYPLRCASDVRAGVAALGLPVVVKGATGAGGGTVRVAKTEADALEAFTAFARSDRCFLQQYVDGPTFFVGGLFQDGEPLRVHGAEVLEQRPLFTGPSIRTRSSTDARLLEPALGAARALRWTGITVMNVMGTKDGSYYFLEFNPRPAGSIDIAAAAGVDLFSPLATMLAGGVAEADLCCRDGVETGVLTKLAMDRLEPGGLRGVIAVALEPRAWLDLPWREPRLLVYLLRRLRWHWQSRTVDRRRARGAASAEAVAREA